MMLKKLALLAVMAVLALPSPSQAANEKIKILSGPTSGAWYVGMGAVAKAINKQFPEIDVNLLPGGGLSNPGRLSKKEGELSIGTHSIMVSAAKGIDPFRKPVTGVSSIFNLNDVSRLHIIGIGKNAPESLESMIKNKQPVHMVVGPMGSGTELWVRWMLATYGVTYKDIQSWGGKVITNNFDDAADMAKDGNVDLLFWLGPGEIWFVVELSKNTTLNWLPVSDELFQKMHDTYGVQRTEIPSTMFSGVVGKNVPALCDAAELLVRSDLSEELVYNMTKAIVEGREDIGTANAGWKTMSPETAPQNLAFPLHPGAAKHYKEIGVLK
ncbi:TAXI family TRAP transporter solute-binding subunit [Mailhella massiliensis]|uniref:TAXI family TRAP transporter solute-binding subunit n=1 Tax=Mailhella massiliensis TaxID=1903261 RepID=UPI0023F4B9DA|nr:TAXI family TRAP transporter solute-binding subunit [Mailhella massiliensis]